MPALRPRSIAIAIAALAALVAFVVGVGRGSDSTPVVCLAVDSTNPTITGVYLGRLEAETRRAARDGATVKAFAFAGSAKVESVPTIRRFAELKTRRAVRGAIREVRREVARASLDLRTARAGTGKRASGSGVLEAVAKAEEGEPCTRIVVLSDGLDGRAFDAYGPAVITRAGRADILDRIKERNLLPALGGVRAVEFPYGGIVPTGSDISRDPARVEALEQMWRRIVETAGSRLRWGQ